MNICTKCNLKRSLDEFHYKNKKKNSKRSICKYCVQELTQKHYKDNRDKYLDRHKKQAADKRAWINTLKTGPCLDCGNTYPPCAMDFDHRDPATKLYSIAQMKRSSKANILIEIDKCDLVCAVCHRLRTHLPT